MRLAVVTGAALLVLTGISGCGKRNGDNAADDPSRMTAEMERTAIDIERRANAAAQEVEREATAELARIEAEAAAEPQPNESADARTPDTATPDTATPDTAMR